MGVYAYKDFLWRETDIVNGDLASFKLSHVSKGPGHVHARSSWNEEATHFFFTCGDRFTAHQHLDVGHFLIYRHAELVGDGGRPRQQFTEVDSRHVRVDRLERPAYLDRRVGFGIVRLVLRWTAREVEEDHVLGAAERLIGGQHGRRGGLARGEQLWER